MILSNARCVFPEGIRDDLEVVVSEGTISEIRPRSSANDGERVDLRGHYLAPGFVDVHVHGAVGRDTMEASAEALAAICGFHAGGGTTSLLLTTATSPIDRVMAVMKTAEECRQKLPQVAGVHLEGPFLSPAKPGAQQQEFMRNPVPELVEALIEKAGMVRRITIAPELPGALEAISAFVARGISVSGGHSDAWEEDARAAFARGMRGTTHTFNCMSSARRRGIYRVAGLLEFALSEPGVICELIADGHHVLPTLMKMLYRAKGAAGICLVTDATAGAGLPDGSLFTLAGKDCVVRDGVCLLADGSALAGSAARMIDLVRTMIREVDVPLHEAITMATATPARAVGLEKKGVLAVGADADLVALSPELEVRQTWVAGQTIFDAQKR